MGEVKLTAIKAEIMRVSHAFSDAVRDCEHFRLNDHYPHDKWRAAWDRRIALHSEWMRLAAQLHAGRSSLRAPGGEQG